MAEASSAAVFRLSAPVVVHRRSDGLTLQGTEGEIHVSPSVVLSAPPGWLDSAPQGVSVSPGPEGAWLLSAAGQPWPVPVVALRWHRPLPALLLPLGQPFRAALLQRVLGRLLVRLLGVPGVVPLLVGWHRRRTRQRA